MLFVSERTSRLVIIIIIIIIMTVFTFTVFGVRLVAIDHSAAVRK